MQIAQEIAQEIAQDLVKVIHNNNNNNNNCAHCPSFNSALQTLPWPGTSIDTRYQVLVYINTILYIAS